MQIDYHKRDLYRNEDFWDDCNLYGLANIDIKAATIMPETYEELKNTIFRYSGLKEYDEQAQEVNPIRYLQNYQKTPQIEILAKLGLSEIVKGINEGRTGIIVDASAKRLDALLGIRRERTKKLIEEKGDARLLRVLQIEKSLDQHWTEEQVNHLRETGLDIAHIAFVLNYMTIQKLLNRIEKYAGCAYETNCGRAVANIRNTAIIYIDYLMMRERRGYDLHNTVYQQPRDLSAANRQMVTETNREEFKKRVEETEERYVNIKKRYRSLRKEYCYEDATYLIRPARSAEEIVMEGRLLHHCVGGNGYLSSRQHFREQHHDDPQHDEHQNTGVQQGRTQAAVQAHAALIVPGQGVQGLLRPPGGLPHLRQGTEIVGKASAVRQCLGQRRPVVHPAGQVGQQLGQGRVLLLLAQQVQAVRRAHPRVEQQGQPAAQVH